MNSTNTKETYRAQPFTPAGGPLPLRHPQPGAVAAHGFAQTFGLHPGMAVLTLAVDAMLFPVDMAMLGASFPVALPVSLVLGAIVFLAQRKWYGDDNESAAIKALILAFLTAIPTPLPAVLYVPAGVVGLFNRGK